MVSPLLNASISKPLPSAFAPTNEFRNTNRISQQNPLRIVSCRQRTEPTKNDQNLRYSQPLLQITVAASLAIVLWSNQAHAGILSGFSGLESVPGPQLPQVDFLTRFNEENQKKYAENDARFRESPLLKKLLEQSKLNKEKNRQEILDKYCIRGAEWGVGDCSAEGMTPEDKEKFIAMLKQKAGVE